MDSVFADGFADSMCDLLAGVARIDYAHHDNALDPAFLALLAEELIAARYKPWMLDTCGPAERLGLRVMTARSRGFPHTRRLQGEFTALVRGCGLDWTPDTVIAQRYPVGHPGLPTHADPPVDKVLVALFPVTGSADFQILESYQRVGVVAEWVSAAGGVTLLRGPAVSVNDGDLGPFHKVSGPIGDVARILLGFHMVRELRGMNGPGVPGPFIPCKGFIHLGFR